VVLAFGAAVAARADVEVVAAVGAGVADFAVDLLVVFWVVGAALVADVLVALFRVEGAVFFVGDFRAAVGAALKGDAGSRPTASTWKPGQSSVVSPGRVGAP
jgi:hypothetical protein